MKENERGGSCSAHGRDEKCVEDFGPNLRLLGNLGLSVRIILKWILQ